MALTQALRRRQEEDEPYRREGRNPALREKPRGGQTARLQRKGGEEATVVVVAAAIVLDPQAPKPDSILQMHQSEGEKLERERERELVK